MSEDVIGELFGLSFHDLRRLFLRQIQLHDQGLLIAMGREKGMKSDEVLSHVLAGMLQELREMQLERLG